MKELGDLLKQAKPTEEAEQIFLLLKLSTTAIASNAPLRDVNDTSRAFDSLSLNSLSNVLHFRTLTPTLLPALAMQTPLRSSVFVKNGKGVANEPAEPSSSIEREAQFVIWFHLRVRLTYYCVRLTANKYRKKFSKSYIFLKQLVQNLSLHRNFYNFNRFPGKQLPKSLWNVHRGQVGDLCPYTIKKIKKLRDTVYPNRK